MTDQEHPENDKDRDQSSSAVRVPLQGGREVVVTRLDSPPPAGKKSIHPRRQAPQVPEHENRTGE
jgi:hypothetical protein